MKKIYVRPWLRPVALCNFCDSFSIDDGEDDDDSDKSRRLNWDDEETPLNVVNTHKYWNE